MSAETIGSAAADAAAAPLDLLLTDAALGVLNRVNPGGSGLRLAAALAARPRLVASRTRNLLGELTRIAAGTSQIEPSRRDRRFADPGWAGNPLLHRVLQAYLASAQTAEGLAQDADLDWSDTERAGFVLRNLIDALAPSNNPVLNPAALKAAIDTGGGSALAGLRHFAADMASPPRIPSMVEPDAFKVGANLAVTPGAVVLRTEVTELIQYRPVTPAVRQVPLLIVPPTINKFYVTDLAPGRSLAEYLVGSGLQVFVMSWRNPDSRHARWDFNTYGQAVLDAMDAVARITGSGQTAITGVCSGGIIARPARPTPAPRPPTTPATPPSRTGATASAPRCPRPARSSGRPATSWPSSATTRSPPPEDPLTPGHGDQPVTAPAWPGPAQPRSPDGDHRGQLPPSRCQPLSALPQDQADGLIRLSGRIPAGGGDTRSIIVSPGRR
jgi:hypothetical protein